MSKTGNIQPWYMNRRQNCQDIQYFFIVTDCYNYYCIISPSRCIVHTILCRTQELYIYIYYEMKVQTMVMKLIVDYAFVRPLSDVTEVESSF